MKIIKFMKLSKNTVLLLWFATLTLLSIVKVNADTKVLKPLETAINRYIAGVAKVTQTAEFKDARQVLFGDLDGDNDKDVVVQFTLENASGVMIGI